jgi:putative SOS response-associated peptidase YedK
MCGRAKLPEDVSEIKLDLKIDWEEIGAYQPRWNAAPTAKLPVVVSRRGERMLTMMRWGLVPGSTRSWAEAGKIGRKTFNARAEAIDTCPAFRTAWANGHRCLIIADGYYEWRDADKQPFAVALRNHGPMTLAGLWDSWTAPGGDTIKSFTIITTTANTLLRPLHARIDLTRQLGWLARRNRGPGRRTQGHAQALSQRRHSLSVGGPAQCTQQQPGSVRAARAR